jgi:hypothetical protein
MGEHLLAMAWREPIGWSWDASPTPTCIRHLTGLAHGAAGFGHAMLELSAWTGDGRYRFAGEQAFRYEGAFVDERTGMWTDLRHRSLNLAFYDNRVDELRADLRSGNRPAPPTPHAMVAWCHGGPGIGLTRLRAHARTGDARHLRDVELALDATVRAFEGVPANYSLCHGHSGNAEFAVEAGPVLARPDAATTALELTRDACERFELGGRPWRCGTAGGLADPGLMLGEAGIGYALLRLFAPATPTLLIGGSTEEGLRRPEPRQAEYDAARVAYVDAYFGVTRRVAAAISTHGTGLARSLSRRLESVIADAPDPVAADRSVRELLETVSDSTVRELLADVAAVDLARFAMTMAITDFTEELLDRLAAELEEGDTELSADDAIALAPHLRVLRTHVDWVRWLAAPAAIAWPPDTPPMNRALLFRDRKRIRVQALGPFAGVVFDLLQTPTTPARLCAAVVAEVEPIASVGPDYDSTIRAAVHRQLATAVAARMITVVPARARDGRCQTPSPPPTQRPDDLLNRDRTPLTLSAERRMA